MAPSTPASTSLGGLKRDSFNLIQVTIVVDTHFDAHTEFILGKAVVGYDTAGQLAVRNDHDGVA